MNQESQLAALLRGNNRSGGGSFLATVTAVEKETIDVMTGDGTEYFDVQLKAAIDPDKPSGIVITPAIGSTVLVNNIEGSNRLYVAMFSGIDEISFTKMNKVNFSEIEEVVFNEGNNGGLILIKELFKTLNDLITTFNNHIHEGVITKVTGNATGTPGKTEKPVSQIETLDQSDYEDTKIKH